MTIHGNIKLSGMDSEIFNVEVFFFSSSFFCCNNVEVFKILKIVFYIGVEISLAKDFEWANTSILELLIYAGPKSFILHMHCNLHTIIQFSMATMKVSLSLVAKE